MEEQSYTSTHPLGHTGITLALVVPIYEKVEKNYKWQTVSFKLLFELYELYNEPEMVKVMIAERSRWFRHICRMQEQDIGMKMILHKLEGSRQVGRPGARGLDSEVEGLKTMCFRNWRRKTQDRDKWCAIVHM